MSGETPETPETGDVVEAARTAFAQRYAGASRLEAEGDGARLALQADLDRDPVQVKGRITDPLQFRAALSALYAIVQSDFSYKPKDRTAYMAYQRMKQKSASLSQWEAQRAYHAWLQRNDPLAFLVLDPIVTVQPDALTLEVFSKDEGTYAQLGIDWSAFDLEGEPLRFGTTNVDFSAALDEGVQRLRSYRATRFSVGRETVALATEGQPEVMEKQIQVPDAWLRGFLQVQSAATLPMTTFDLAPMDLYNLLRHLRLHGDRKTGGRAVRVELVPGESPRLVLEPWEEVMQTAGAAYTGRVAQVVRIWGRRRLMLVRRFLPFVESIQVHLLGSGLPNFWVMKAGPYTLTLGMTGFTAANWSKTLSFDVLLPRPDGSEGSAPVLDWLRAHWKGSAAEVAKGAGVAPAAARKALQALCQAGLVMFDLAHGLYRLRPLAAQPIDPARLAYRNVREREAHDLLAVKDAVRIVKENYIHGQGMELEGKVAVAAEKREYRPVMLVDDEARVTRADCTCRFFRTQGLKNGPCTHLTALAILHARLEAKRAEQRGKGRASVVVETRTWSRRHPRGEAVCQVSLDHTHVRIRWGERSDVRLRLQHLVFSSQVEARAAYFARIDDLEAQGFLDATAG